jgi:uncharacterized cupredoxin-like copper-binding protein
MKQITMKLIAAAAGITWAAAAFAHEKAPHSPKSAVPKQSVPKQEQKPWGIAGDAKAAKRTIAITMSDAMRFSPDQITVKQGETVRFVVSNAGKMLHELVIGTKKELDEHAALMLKFPNMEHDEPYMAHVAAGKKSEIVWTFNRAGEFEFACLIAGHYQAGMVGKIKVLSVSSALAVPSDGVVTVQAGRLDTAPEMAEAEVRKVDKDAKKVTLKHGPIKSLDMPSMTMVFQVKDPALLDKLAAGDKILFSAEQQQGAFVVTGVEKPAK